MSRWKPPRRRHTASPHSTDLTCAVGVLLLSAAAAAAGLAIVWLIQTLA